MHVVQKKEMKMFNLVGAPQHLYRCLPLLECVPILHRCITLLKHLQISVDVKLFVHDSYLNFLKPVFSGVRVTPSLVYV